MPMVYEDDHDAQALIEDYLQVEDFETGEEGEGLGRFPLWARGRSRRNPYQRHPRFSVPPRRRRRVYRRVTRPRAHTRRVTPHWYRRHGPTPVAPATRHRQMTARARWARFRRAQQIAKCRNLLARKGMLSDYLQVEGNDLDPGLGQLDIFKKVLTAIGIRDPITHYEPGASLSEVYAKYRGMVSDMDKRIDLLRSDKQKKPLKAAIAPIKSLLTSVSRAFVAGAKPGKRDRDRLAEVVQASRTLKRQLRAAERAVGTAAPTITPEDPTPEPPADVKVPATVTVTEEVVPDWVYYAGGGVLALAVLGVALARR